MVLSLNVIHSDYTMKNIFIVPTLRVIWDCVQYDVRKNMNVETDIPFLFSSFTISMYTVCFWSYNIFRPILLL